MAAHGRNDARIAARSLASTAKDCLGDPASGPAHAVALNNVFRLLEAYRVNSFFGLEPATSHAHAGESLLLIPPLEENVGEVRNVLDGAVATAFAGQSSDEAIAIIEGVLKLVAYPELGAPPDEEKTKTTHFFSEVVRRLQFA